VNGRKVQGQLACEMQDRLVFYSPNLGSVASFEKRFVVEYVLLKDKKQVKLNAPRPLTAEEAHYMGWNGWPDAAPEKGPVPAYAKETWAPPKRLLVWAKPGAGGDFSKTENWTVYGEPLTGTEWWDEQTDVLIPSAPGDQYKLVPGNHPELPEGRLSYTVRHMMVERNGFIQTAGGTVYGNEWVHRRGKTNLRFAHGWKGGRNTYARFDFLPIYQLGVTGLDVMWGLWEGADKVRVRPETETDIGQYLSVDKEANASVELLGVITSRDKINLVKGSCIAGPDCQVMSDTRSGDHVDRGATLVLLDGAIWGKRVSFGRPDSIHMAGTFLAGLPDRPLTRDTTLILDRKDYTSILGGDEDRRDAAGLRIYPNGTMRIYSSDPTKARLVIRNSRCDDGPGQFNMGPGQQGQYRNRWTALPHFVDVALLGDVVLDGVVFEDLWKGGVRLANLKQKDAWKNVTFGPGCQSRKPEDLYAVYRKDTPPSGWAEDPAVKNPPAVGAPEPACAGDAKVEQLRQEVKAAEARVNQASRAYKQVVGDDDKLLQGMAAFGQARWELWKADRVMWLAILASPAASASEAPRPAKR
jgi:hypothetical protein